MGTDRAPLAITMGDPAGIGPEIVVRALAALPARAVVVGDAGVLSSAAETAGIDAEVRPVSDPAEVGEAAGVVHVLAATELDDVPVGRVDRACGAAALRYVELGAALALDGSASALVTAPVNKEALSLAGTPHPGHTELLAELAGAETVAMMLVSPELRVVLVSVHVPLREALEQLTVERELATIALAAEGARRLGAPAPRVAVAGVNPHAGEHGLFGDEETALIEPAIAAARERGIDASGPWAPDTVFMRARAGEFDVVVAQYHDQGLIPVKYLGLEHGVNVTLGLPFVRTSVDHGTAFDIAGTGRADPASLIAAIRLAGDLTSAPASDA